MTQGYLRVALVSADSAFRDAVRIAMAELWRGAAPGAELTVPFAEFGDPQLQVIRTLQPDLIVLDLERDPDTGLRLARYLAEEHPRAQFLAAGPVQRPELLLAAMRAGIGDYVPKPAEAEAVTEALQRASERLGRSSPERERPVGKLFAFFSPKGGGGATTAAANLAIVLHRTSGKKTLLVDLDLEMGETALVLGVAPKFNFVDFVENFRRMDAGLLASYIEQHESGVHLLSAPLQPDRSGTVSPDQLRRILGFLRQFYDYVLVDTPRSFGAETLAVFEQADLTFIVTTSDLPSIRNIQRALPLLRRVLPHGGDQIRLLLNRFNPADAITPADIERTLDLKVFWKLSNDYEAVMGSVNEGRPIVLNGSGSAYCRDLKALGAALADKQPEHRGPGGLRGALRRMVRRSPEGHGAS